MGPSPTTCDTNDITGWWKGVQSNMKGLSQGFSKLRKRIKNLHVDYNYEQLRGILQDGLAQKLTPITMIETIKTCAGCSDSIGNDTFGVLGLIAWNDDDDQIRDFAQKVHGTWEYTWDE